MSLHSKLTKIHVAENWSFANLAARQAIGTYATADIGKIGYQQDNNTYWRLVNVTSPGGTATPTWKPLNSITIEVGIGLTSTADLSAKDVSELPFGYKVILTVDDSDSFYTFQNGDPTGDDLSTPVAHTRWRKTGGY